MLKNFLVFLLLLYPLSVCASVGVPAAIAPASVRVRADAAAATAASVAPTLPTPPAPPSPTYTLVSHFDFTTADSQAGNYYDLLHPTITATAVGGSQSAAGWTTVAGGDYMYFNMRATIDNIGTYLMVVEVAEHAGHTGAKFAAIIPGLPVAYIAGGPAYNTSGDMDMDMVIHASSDTNVNNYGYGIVNGSTVSISTDDSSHIVCAGLVNDVNGVVGPWFDPGKMLLVFGRDNSYLVNDFNGEHNKVLYPYATTTGGFYNPVGVPWFNTFYAPYFYSATYKNLWIYKGNVLPSDWDTIRASKGY